MGNIPGTNTPAIVWGLAGPVLPTGPQILAGIQQDYDVAFNITFNWNLTTPQGQLATTQEAVSNNAYQFWAWLVTQVDPAYSTGRMQDAIARISFLTRQGAESTSLQVTCLGAVGTVLPAGPLSFATIVDPSGNIYQATQGGTIPGGGSIVLSFAAVVPGPTAVPQSVKIQQSIPGWDLATLVSGAEGQNAETSQQFELRRRQSVAANARNTNDAILGELLSVAGVLDAYVLDNPTPAPVTIGGQTIGANAIYCCVAGGAQADVASAIFRKKPPGTPMTGSTTVVVSDQNAAYSPPFPSYTIKYQVPTTLQVYFGVTIANSPQVPADAVTQIQNAIVAAFNGTLASTTNSPAPPRARIGSVIYALQYSSVLASLGSWAAPKALTVGSANTAGAVFDGYVNGTVLTVTAVTSGTVATGQWIAGGDSVNAITAGTRITSNGSGSGGTGTYNINNSQTVGATFTGTGSGTNLTASAVTGQIQPGDVVLGTGVPGNTIIASQTSGTPGGAGVYVTNNATTSAGAALTANVVVTGVAADQALVAVQINQEPTISAANIAVTLS